MALVKRYFSFTDPVTGKLTKGYGFSGRRTQNNIVVKIVNGVTSVLKNEVSEKDYDVQPIYQDVAELTQEEFDALDVSEESLLSKIRREKELLSLKRLETKFANDTEVNIADVVAKFEKFVVK